MYCYIYLFRHGQTYYNKNHYFTGWKDSKLTARGIKDAKKVANKLKNKRIDIAFQTHLSRSKDTLKYVLKYHPECQLVVEDDRMIERSYGTLEGTSHKKFIERIGHAKVDLRRQGDAIENLHPKLRKKVEKFFGNVELSVIRRSYDIPPPGGESVKEVENRVNDFLKDLLKFIKATKANVAISAHGNSMRPFRKYFEKLTRAQMMKLENPWDKHFEFKVKV